MDAWKAPEPSPYFITRLNARMREEREAAPAGWLARLRAGFAYGPRSHVRPLAAMALTVMLLVGGGTYLGVNNWTQPQSRRMKRPWCTICRLWITMLNCWIRSKISPRTITGSKRRVADIE